MSRLLVLVCALAVRNAWGQSSDLLEESAPQGELRAGARSSPAAPLDVNSYRHKSVAPAPRPAASPTSPAGSSIVEKVRFLSTVQAGTWTGYRYRGAGTGAAAGGIQVSATTPHGWKPSLMFGGDTIGIGVGRSRVGAGALWDGHHVDALVYIQPVNF